MFVAVRAAGAGAGHNVQVVGRGGRVVETIRHLPWFVADTKPREVPPIIRAEQDGTFLAYSPELGVYVPQGPAWKVYVMSAGDVPDAAARVTGAGGKAGLYNIKYLVRAAYDLQRANHKLLGLRTPLAFLPNQEMIEELERAIEIAAGFKVLVFDIEVLSTRGGFPARGDPIASIAFASFNLGDDIFSPEWPDANVEVLFNDDPESTGANLRLVRRFIGRVLEEKPDFIVGYNTSHFDFPYLAPFLPGWATFDKDFFVVDGDDPVVLPHIDLMQVRGALGASLGLRSQSAWALDAVAIEIVKSAISKFYDMAWLFESRYLEAERKLDHAKIAEFYRRRDPLLIDYIKADVLLTSYLARTWIPPLLVLSALTGIPPNVQQSLNTGQMAEYVLAELFVRLGFYPELRRRSRDFHRISRRRDDIARRVPDYWVFERGKTYARDWGRYGAGDDEVVHELDFAQLYPTDMVVNTVDPTSLYVADTAGDATTTPTISEDKLRDKLRIFGRQSWALLVWSEERNGRKEERAAAYKVVPGYGPAAWLTYKLYSARNATKKFKKKAKELGRIEYLAPDQAVKIFNNSLYGSFSKRRGNFVNELLSAAVFWRTQKLQYEVIGAAENIVKERFSAPGAVAYSDTDSVYVATKRSVDIEQLADEINTWIAEKYSPMYKMEAEGTYDEMIIPKQKDSNAPSAKSYLNLVSGKVVKLKGEFYKLQAPLAIKDRLAEFYEAIVAEAPENVDQLSRLVLDFLAQEPLYKWFLKSSVSSFVNEDDPRLLKNLNKDFHYAALVSLCETGAPGAEALVRRKAGMTTFIPGADGVEHVKCRIDPRVVERTQRAVIIHYLPHSVPRKPKRFILLIADHGDEVEVLDVSVEKVEKEWAGTSEQDRYEKAYRITYVARRRRIPREELRVLVANRLRWNLVASLAAKLLPALHKKIELDG